MIVLVLDWRFETILPCPGIKDLLRLPFNVSLFLLQVHLNPSCPTMEISLPEKGHLLIAHDDRAVQPILNEYLARGEAQGCKRGSSTTEFMTRKNGSKIISFCRRG